MAGYLEVRVFGLDFRVYLGSVREYLRLSPPSVTYVLQRRRCSDTGRDREGEPWQFGESEDVEYYSEIAVIYVP
jgi:hypothetical protein